MSTNTTTSSGINNNQQQQQQPLNSGTGTGSLRAFQRPTSATATTTINNNNHTTSSNNTNNVIQTPSRRVNHFPHSNSFATFTPNFDSSSSSAFHNNNAATTTLQIIMQHSGPQQSQLQTKSINSSPSSLLNNTLILPSNYGNNNNNTGNTGNTGNNNNGGGNNGSITPTSGTSSNSSNSVNVFKRPQQQVGIIGGSSGNGGFNKNSVTNSPTSNSSGGIQQQQTLLKESNNNNTTNATNNTNSPPIESEEMHHLKGQVKMFQQRAKQLEEQLKKQQPLPNNNNSEIENNKFKLEVEKHKKEMEKLSVLLANSKIEKEELEKHNRDLQNKLKVNNSQNMNSSQQQNNNNNQNYNNNFKINNVNQQRGFGGNVGGSENDVMLIDDDEEEIDDDLINLLGNSSQFSQQMPPPNGEKNMINLTHISMTVEEDDTVSIIEDNVENNNKKRKIINKKGGSNNDDDDLPSPITPPRNNNNEDDIFNIIKKGNDSSIFGSPSKSLNSTNLKNINYHLLRGYKKRVKWSDMSIAGLQKDATLHMSIYKLLNVNILQESNNDNIMKDNSTIDNLMVSSDTSLSDVLWNTHRVVSNNQSKIPTLLPILDAYLNQSYCIGVDQEEFSLIHCDIELLECTLEVLYFLLMESEIFRNALIDSIPGNDTTTSDTKIVDETTKSIEEGLKQRNYSSHPMFNNPNILISEENKEKSGKNKMRESKKYLHYYVEKLPYQPDFIYDSEADKGFTFNSDDVPVKDNQTITTKCDIVTTLLRICNYMFDIGDYQQKSFFILLDIFRVIAWWCPVSCLPHFEPLFASENITTKKIKKGCMKTIFKKQDMPFFIKESMIEILLPLCRSSAILSKIEALEKTPFVRLAAFLNTMLPSASASDMNNLRKLILRLFTFVVCQCEKGADILAKDKLICSSAVLLLRKELVNFSNGDTDELRISIMQDLIQFIACLRSKAKFTSNLKLDLAVIILMLKKLKERSKVTTKDSDSSTEDDKFEYFEFDESILSQQQYK
ncbi:hypothetical protein ABK040_002179 [Willaertia magna]